MVVVLGVGAVTFLMVDLLPGDVAYDIAGQDTSLADIQAIREELGLDRNILVRYGQWMKNAVRGDLGMSFRTHEPVLEAILSRLPVTVELMIVAQVFALLLALPAGIVSAYKQGTRLDNALGAGAFATMSTPVFVMALVLVYCVSLKLRWLPATGYVPLSESVRGNLRAFVLPGVSIALVEWVPLMRVLRSDMIATLQEDYILMARSKGLPACRILFGHALRPSAFTLITLLGLQIGHLIGGALIVEIIFALPGIGRLLVGAIYGRDVYLVQGCVLFIATAYVAVNFIVDLLYAALDPRIGKERIG